MRERLLDHALKAVALAINAQDPYTLGHSGRVAEYCDRLARSMGLSDDERFLLSLSAWLHDVGNLWTPTYILKKPSVLAEEEMEEMRIHPVKGAEIFGGNPELADVARAIRHHHERMDGTGYPDGLKGEAIPLFSRMILVADAFEAMTHDRAYRRAMPHAEALGRIQEGAGMQFDPKVVEHFVAVLRAGEGV